jgi:demethylspheroidene O-methyltransferase
MGARSEPAAPPAPQLEAGRRMELPEPPGPVRLSLRDRLLSSRGFQRWALRFPLTRFVAKRRAAALFDLCAGFVYSQVLLACVNLRLFTFLDSAPRPLGFISARLGLTREATLTLLRAAAALDLVESRDSGDRWSLGRQGAALLGNPGLLPMIEHHALFYRDLSDPVGLLRHSAGNTALSDFWAYARSPAPESQTAEQVEAYSALMAASQSFIADEVLDAYDFRRHRNLLDVGGGDGSFCIAAARAAPRLSVLCFDLPAVAERARLRFSAAGLGSRAAVAGGDFKAGVLPDGADVVSLIRVLHDHDDATVLRVLRAAYRVLPPKGAIVIAEPMSGTHEAPRVADVYFGFYLWAMGSGKPRTAAELIALLRRAGFDAPRLARTRLPMNVRVLVARRDKSVNRD